MSKKLNYKNYFPVWYQLGSGGTFFIWFVNQHKNFLHHDIIYLKQLFNKEQNKFTNCEINNYTHANISIEIWKRGDTSLKSYINYLKETFGPFNKLAVRQTFHGFKFDLSKEHKYCKHIIFDPSDSTYMINRHKTLIDDGKPIYYTYKNTNVIKKLITAHAEYLLCDSYKLLSTDDNEYYKLCKYLDTDPLDNWKDLINEYKDKINLKV